MKNYQIVLVAIAMIMTNSMYSQIRIGGGISIGVNIDLPIPDIVVVERRTDLPRPRNPRCGRAVIHTCDHRCNPNFGTIQHQNGPNGRYIFEVVNVSLAPINNGEEKLIYNLDTGEELEIIISTIKGNDYNYHYLDRNCNNCRPNSNVILAVFLNGEELPLRNGSLSLQPIGNGRFHSVVNLHSFYDGDFNGTVNF